MPKPITKKQNLDNNKGLIEIEKPAPSDYIFGGKEVKEQVDLQPDGDWSKFLPNYEAQKRGFETWACVSFAVNNAIEVLIRKKYNIQANFSDRYLAKVSDTIIGRGNLFSEVAQAVRDHGLVSESAYPYGGESVNEYYQEVPQSVINEGENFNQNYSFEYEWVDWSEANKKRLAQGLKKSPLVVSLYAWNESLRKNGIYQDPNHNKTNHAVLLFDFKEEEYLKVFDHYEQKVKKLAWDHYIGAAMKFSLNKRTKFKLIRAWNGSKVYAVDAQNKLHHIKPNMDALWAGVEAGFWDKNIELTTKNKIESYEMAEDIILKDN